MSCLRIQRLLWDEIRESLNPAEEEEVRRIMGSNSIDRNADLFEEMKALAEILDEFTESSLAQQEALRSRPKLPEPVSKKLLANNIRIMLDDIERSKSASVRVDEKVLNYVRSPPKRAGAGGSMRRPGSSPGLAGSGSGAGAASRSGGRSRGLGGSAGGSGGVGSRGGSGGDSVASLGVRANGGRSNRQRLSRPGSALSTASSRPSSAALSISSAPADLVESFSGKLSISKINKMHQQLRAQLNEEARELQGEIDFLNTCLEMQHGENVAVKQEAEGVKSPSLRELQEASSVLEKAFVAGGEAAHGDSESGRRKRGGRITLASLDRLDPGVAGAAAASSSSSSSSSLFAPPPLATQPPRKVTKSRSKASRHLRRAIRQNDDDRFFSEEDLIGKW